jgi:hypothetical protein
MYDNTKDRNFLSKEITGDESWVYEGQGKGTKIRGRHGDSGQVAGSAGDYHDMEVLAVRERRWAQCINSEWDCFEGDSMNLYGKPKVYIVEFMNLRLTPNVLVSRHLATACLNKERGKDVER